jgi:hypothetical protein
MFLIDTANSGEKNVVKKETEKILKYKKPYNRKTANAGCKYQQYQ